MLMSTFLMVGRAQDDSWPDWKKHSWWCAHDKGSSGGVYRNMCTTHDQFDSVVACQKDSAGENGGSVQSVQAAGRQAVNEFMDAYKPSTCR